MFVLTSIPRAHIWEWPLGVAGRCRTLATFSAEAGIPGPLRKGALVSLEGIPGKLRAVVLLNGNVAGHDVLGEASFDANGAPPLGRGAAITVPWFPWDKEALRAKLADGGALFVVLKVGL